MITTTQRAKAYFHHVVGNHYKLFVKLHIPSHRRPNFSRISLSVSLVDVLTPFGEVDLGDVETLCALDTRYRTLNLTLDVFPDANQPILLAGMKLRSCRAMQDLSKMSLDTFLNIEYFGVSASKATVVSVGGHSDPQVARILRTQYSFINSSKRVRKAKSTPCETIVEAAE